MSENKEKAKAKLSKSSFIRGLQCEKSLYLDKNRPFLRGKIPEEQRAKFKRGHEIGFLAQQLFPGGINVAPKSPSQYKKAFLETKELIESGQNIIYEAAFSAGGVNILLDILLKDGDSWKAIEVKSSKKISDTYLWDASLQYYVLIESGIDISDFQICYIDAEYIKTGDIDISKLFKFESVLPVVKDRLPAIKEKIIKLYDVIQLSSSPDIKIGTQCNYPYPCDFIKHCWKKTPKHSALNIFGLDESKRFELFHSELTLEDILLIENIPELSKKHIESILNNKPIINGEVPLKYNNVAFYRSMHTSSALPVYDNSSPFDRIGLGYAIFKDGSTSSIIFDPEADPAEKNTEELQKQISDIDHLFVFDKKTESEILINASKRLKNEAFDPFSIIDKMVCIKELFLGGKIIFPDMAIIEKSSDILKSFGVDINCFKSDINTNLRAGILYNELRNIDDAEEINKTRNKLSQYLEDEVIILEKTLNLLMNLT